MKKSKFTDASWLGSKRKTPFLKKDGVLREAAEVKYATMHEHEVEFKVRFRREVWVWNDADRPSTSVIIADVDVLRSIDRMLTR